MTTARLIMHAAGDGAQNMAVDEALLKSAAGRGIVTLRFYRWSAPTLSLGYFQSAVDRDQHVASRACELIRRASGGGAILHDHELTYSFSTPARSRFGDAGDLYLAFHETLVEVLADQGVLANLHDSGDGLSDNAFLCLQRRASGDVVLNGHKILGSAQRRWRTAMLQHGSLLLKSSRHAPELPGLRELTGVDVHVEPLLQTWRERLSQRLKSEFQVGHLTDMEEQQATSLKRDKFQNPAWTERR